MPPRSRLAPAGSQPAHVKPTASNYGSTKVNKPPAPQPKKQLNSLCATCAKIVSSSSRLSQAIRNHPDESRIRMAMRSAVRQQKNK